MFSRRRRRKSPEPDSSQNSQATETPDAGPRRRRADHNGSTPHHHTPVPASPLIHSSSAKKKPPSLLPTFQAGNTCNSFLLGGQYPTKDHRRIRTGTRRTLWYRIFFSSPWRAVVSVVLFSYILLWHVLVPATHVLLDFGRTISGGKHGFMHVKSLSLPPLDLQRKEALKIQQERDRLHYDRRHDERFKVLQEVVPKRWYRDVKDNKARDVSDDETAHEQHARPDGVAKQRTRQHRQQNGRSESSDGEVEERGTRHVPPNPDAKSAKNDAKEQTKQSTNKTASEPVVADADKSDAVSDSAKADKAANVHTDTKKKENVIPMRRTLENMDSFPNQSSCPVDLSPTDINTTLVIQSSLERLWILKETCQRWKSPIVAAVYMPHGTEENHHCIVAAKTSCSQLTIVPLEAAHDAAEWAYPVNRLRNMALDAVRTSHILVADIDFVPSMNLDETIQSTIVEQEPLINSTEQQAMIVPAFERLPPEPCTKENDCSDYLKKNSSFIPQTLEDLRACTTKKECSVFQSSNNWEGHYSTQSGAWLKGSWYEEEDVTTDTTERATVKRIRTIKCFDSLRYEPYVVLRWCPASNRTATESPAPVAPYYDERFYSYGKNKIQVISHLRFMGYHFSVLPKGFIVHNPHADSDAKNAWLDVNKHKLHQEMDALYYQFLEELWAKYKGTTDYIVHQCKRPEKKKKKAG